jgi:hypothetical protein
MENIPPLSEVYELDRQFFEDFPNEEYGTRLPHPDEWPVPYEMLHDMVVIIKKEAGIRMRFLVNVPGSWQR